MEKWERRERKLRKRRSQDMVVSNRSLKTVILPTIGKKAQEVKRDRRAKGRQRDA
jgi:hypothetical protein